MLLVKLAVILKNIFPFIVVMRRCYYIDLFNQDSVRFMDLNSVNIFVNVVQQGSFSGASKIMNIPVATVSRRVSDLEAQLEQRLLVRTTRKLSLTHAGKVLFQRASVGLDEIFAARQAMNDEQAEYKGKLRISMQPGMHFLDEMFHAFNRAYPHIQLEVYISTRRVDFIDDDIDFIVRTGNLTEQSAVARYLGRYRHILVCTPAFIEQYGQPQEPNELLNMPVAAWITNTTDVVWQLGEHKIELQPKFISNDCSQVLSALRSGDMIGELPPRFASYYLESGELVEVLAQYPMPSVDGYLLYPNRTYLSRINRAFIEDIVSFCHTHIEGRSVG